MTRQRSALTAACCVALVAGLVPPAGAIQSDRIRYGEVIVAEQALIETGPDKSGTRSGATIGAIAGYAIADGDWLGVAIGGLVGGAVGRGSGKKKGWLLAVRLDNGEVVGVQVIGNADHFVAGDKVRLFTRDNGEIHVRKR